MFRWLLEIFAIIYVAKEASATGPTCALINPDNGETLIQANTAKAILDYVSSRENNDPKLKQECRLLVTYPPSRWTPYLDYKAAVNSVFGNIPFKWTSFEKAKEKLCASP